MPVRTLKTAALAAALGCAAVLAGCAGMDLDRKREVSMTTIDDNLYLYTVYLPYETRAYRAREYAAGEAMDYCGKTNRGSQPIEATTKARKEGGFEVRYVFRCVGYLPAPEQPFVDHNSSVS